jgi:hypothetical protein
MARGTLGNVTPNSSLTPPGRQNPLQIRQKLSRRTAFKESDLVLIV